MVLPQAMRLKGYKCFDYIHRNSKNYRSQSMVLKVAKAKNSLIERNLQCKISNSCRCAISISNKVSKKAVVRNRLRRLLHEHLRRRLFRQSQFINNWALISLNPNCLDKHPNNLLKECDKLLFEAGFCS